MQISITLEASKNKMPSFGGGFLETRIIQKTGEYFVWNTAAVMLIWGLAYGGGSNNCAETNIR